MAICLLSAMGPLLNNYAAYLTPRLAWTLTAITPYGGPGFNVAVNNLFTERLLALVYTECLICGNFAV